MRTKKSPISDRGTGLENAGKENAEIRAGLEARRGDWTVR
jgi:hypothetical protein